MRPIARWVMSMPIQRRLRRCATEIGGAASAERIEDEVAFVGAGFDDAFEQGFGLLRRIAEPLFRHHVDWVNVSPYILEGNAGHLIKVTLVLRHVAGLVLDDASFVCDKLCHFILLNTANSGKPPMTS